MSRRLLNVAPALAALTLAAATNAASANLIANGSFEERVGGLPYSWNSVLNLGVVNNQGASDGDWAVAFSVGNVPSNGFISQAFATVPGVEYKLSFDFGKYSVNQPDEVARLDVGVFDSTLTPGFGGPSLLSLTVSDDTPGPGNSVADATVYDPYSYLFTATGTLATLRFLDTSDAQSPGGGFDAMLDNVSVVAVPEPSTALVGLGLAVGGVVRSRRRR